MVDNLQVAMDFIHRQVRCSVCSRFLDYSGSASVWWAKDAPTLYGYACWNDEKTGAECAKRTREALVQRVGVSRARWVPFQYLRLHGLKLLEDDHVSVDNLTILRSYLGYVVVQPSTVFSSEDVSS